MAGNIQTSPITTMFKTDTSQLDKAQGKLGGLSKVAGAAAIGGAAATAVFAQKSVSAFMGFEQGMTEVFTLMPGASQDTFDSMEADVKNFSKQFGVATDEAIPALYDSLSAGVPQENVFQFMEDAQKLAVAGNTDTASSVDLLTTVVNAYGMDASEAGRVSDVMFKTVQQGKTTIDELGDSIFQVAPIAGQMGVSIEDVGASMAGLTAVGIPTSVAANSMKAALGELSKPASAVSKTFKEVSGQTFPDFIAGGGDMSEAMKLLVGAAEEGDVAVGTMFGSIEGGQAISALAQDMDGFDEAVSGMVDSTGATDEGFETMSETAAFAFDQLKAKGEIFLIEVGEKLLPPILEFVEYAAPKLEELGAVFSEKLSPVIETVSEYLKDLFEKGGEGSSKLEPLTDAVSDIWEALEGLIDTISSIDWSPVFSDNEGKMGEFSEKATKAFEAIGGAIEAVIDLASDFWEIFGEDIVAGVSYAFGFALDFIGGVLDIISGIFNTFAAAFKGDWDGVWDGIIETLTAVGELKDIVSGALKDVGKFLMEKFLEGLKVIYGQVSSWLTEKANSIAGFFAEIPGKLYNVGVDLIDKTWQGLKDKWGEVVGWFEEKANSIGGFFSEIPTKMFNVGINLIDGIWRGLKNKWSSVKGWFEEKADELPGVFKSTLGISSPSRVFIGLAEEVVNGVNVGLANVPVSSVQIPDMVAPSTANQTVSLPQASANGQSPLTYSAANQSTNQTAGNSGTNIERLEINVAPGDEGTAESIAWKFQTMG